MLQLSWQNQFFFSASLLCCASLCMMLALSIDRYIALHFHLSYHQIITTRRVCAFITFTWAYSLFFALSYLWNRILYYVITVTGMFVTFVAIPVVYIKIYRSLRGQHGNQVQPQANVQNNQQAGSAISMSKYKKNSICHALGLHNFYHLLPASIFNARNCCSRRLYSPESPYSGNSLHGSGYWIHV